MEIDMTNEIKHGSPYDRGGADSYYRRGRRPHYYINKDTPGSRRVEQSEMTAEQIALYHKGFDDNEERQEYKDWG
jgi:hypothetical protein